MEPHLNVPLLEAPLLDVPFMAAPFVAEAEHLKAGLLRGAAALMGWRVAGPPTVGLVITGTRILLALYGVFQSCQPVLINLMDR